MITKVTKVKSAPYTVYQFVLMGEEFVISNQDGKYTLFTKCDETTLIDGKPHTYWRGDAKKNFRQLFANVETVYNRKASE